MWFRVSDVVLTLDHSSIQQPSIYTRNITQRVDTDPTDPVITQGQMYPQAFNQSAMLSQEGPLHRVRPHSIPDSVTIPQLTSSERSLYPVMIQYPLGKYKQQIMEMSSNASRTRMLPLNRGASYIRVADNTSSQSVSSQSSFTSNPNNVSSLYSHSTYPAPATVQLTDENMNKTSSPLHRGLLSSFLLPPQPRLPLVSILYLMQ